MNFFIRFCGIKQKPTLFGFAFLFTFSFASLICAAPGDLDSTFGSGGKVLYRYNDRTDSFHSVAVQPDGKILVAGINGSNQMMVLRYNAGGTLDSSFASGGVYTWSLSTYSYISKIALQTDGKIVVAGYTDITGANKAYLISRLNAGGSMDNSFGSGGVVLTNLSPNHDFINDVVIQTDGKILVTGSYDDRGLSGGDIAVVRYLTNGTLDTSFGGDGIVVTAIGTNAELGSAVKLQSDGKIVVLARSDTGFSNAPNSLALVRYLPDGTPDATFGNNGISLSTFSENLDSFFAGDLEIQADGKIVVTASIGNQVFFVYSFSIFRFLPDGSPDTAFGTNGKTIAASGDSSTASALLIQPNGKIIAVGHADLFSSGLDILIARLNSDGTFDAGFGNGGKVITSVGPTPRSDYAFDAVLQSDGKLLVAGDYNMGTLFDYDAVLLRYIGDAPGIQSKTQFDFDGDGKADISTFRPANAVWYLQQSQSGLTGITFGQPSDKLVPADYDGDGKTDVAVYRDGTWFMQRSEAGFRAVVFGAGDDVPQPADFDGDGKCELAVYRPSNGIWYMYNLVTNQTSAVPFGAAEDKPVAADYDGDGRADAAVFRPSTGTWYLRRSTAGFTAVAFGEATDKPVIGDYDGDGKTDIAVFRPSTAVWYLLRSQDGLTGFQFGLESDQPTPADYDGDGKTDVAVYRDGIWYLNRSTAGFTGVAFGASTDKPVPNAFIP